MRVLVDLTSPLVLHKMVYTTLHVFHIFFLNVYCIILRYLLIRIEMLNYLFHMFAICFYKNIAISRVFNLNILKYNALICIIKRAFIIGQVF